MKRTVRKQVPFVIILLIIFVCLQYCDRTRNIVLQKDSGQEIRTLFETKRSKIQVAGSGQVVKLLADDLQGSKHQKFIVEVDPSLTVLISHNIDLAPRINDLREGDYISFFGEYVYNTKGGLVHWTHHDPQGRHVDGWLKHKGKIYK